MAITKEQWAEIEARLSHPIGSVELLCDGYTVQARVEHYKMKLAVVVYVNGEIKGAWFKGEHDIPKKFHQAKKRYVCSAKQRDEAKRKLRKRFIRDCEPLRDFFSNQVTQSHTYYYPWWTNSKAFCRHIRKTCASIEIVKIGY